ncbi:MAG: hypothetical protein JSR17_10085 [Proteobacteria bacterium]|nr:hypothetical protein [Pseudomonadota bacterium]
MYWLDFIAKAGLACSHTPILAGILVLGLLSKHREKFARAAFLTLFTIIYNLYLKSLWQMPLPPPLEGWAFPSGHMHSAVVFWGWLAIEFNKVWFYEIVFFILTFVGYGLVQQGYHYPVDVLASVGFGSVSILLYAIINRLPFFKQHSERVGFLMAILSGCVFLLLPGPAAQKPHVIGALSIIAGFSIAWALYQLKQCSQSCRLGTNKV